MKYNLLLLILLSISSFLIAQPAITPAPGFEWVKTGDGIYTDNGVTAPVSPDATTFGVSGDTDPADCSTYCGANCDGDALLEKIVFGGTSLPASSCEQRAFNMVHWINSNPESDVADGANTGTVNLVTASQIEIVGDGTSISGAENKGFIIGGNGPGNFSEFNTQVDYNINWHIDDYSLTGGSGTQTQQFTWNWGEPGGGAELEMSGWNGYSTDAFTTTGSEVLTVPTSAVIENGGMMEVVIEGSMEMFLSRNYGNADGKVQTVPSLEGEAIYTVNYDIWEIQAILPVELTSFSGKVVEDDVLLNWSTSTEINSELFLIERSDNNTRWEVIGSVASYGDSYIDRQYSYQDKSPNATQNFYRLRQIDKDGAESLSDIISVSNNNVSKKYTIYPNPVSDQLSISNMSASEIGIIRNQSGAIILRFSSAQNVDMSELPPGLYLFSVLNADESVEWSQRFIKL